MGTEVNDGVATLAVRDLVRAQLRPDEDPWELALVQRDLVWKQDRMASLLDSLLAGYPIGSLLLCRVETETDTRPLGSNQGQERRTASGTPQLVDGQQRAFALLSLFTERGYGSFYLSLTRAWDRSLRHIEWRPRIAEVVDEASTEAGEAVPADFADLSLWASVADEICATLTDETLEVVVAQLTEGFTIPNDPQVRATILARLRRLCHAWQDKRIPVVTATVDEPEDILELFTRVNRGGAPVSGNDLYFAAVKTFWHDPTVSEATSITAKQALSAVELASASFLDLWGALSLVSRLALVGLGEADMVPMRVERLSRASKGHVVRALRAVAPVVAERIEPFTAQLRAETKLKQGLRFAHPHLWEEVFAWVVAANRQLEAKWAEEDLSAVEAYLIGGTLFSYPSILGDPYRRDALAVALDAGAAGRPFPLEGLLSVARNRGENLRRGRSAVAPITAIVDIAKRNSMFIVAAAQGLDDHVADLDWDHILPSDYKQRAFRLSPGAGRRFREEADHFNDPGNLWQIDLRANRTVKEDAPKAKFRQLEEWSAQDDSRGRVSPSRHPGLTPEDIADFEKAGRLLDAGQIDEGAGAFATVVTRRSEWLVGRLLKWPSSPPIAAFAADSFIPPIDTPRLPEHLPQILGVASIRQDLHQSRERARAEAAQAKADMEILLGLEGVWSGQAAKVEWVLRELTKRQAKVSGSGIGWWHWSDVATRSLARSIPLLPLESEDLFTLKITGMGTDRGKSPFRLGVGIRSPGFATIRARLLESGAASVADVDDGVELELPLSPELDWGQSLEAVDREVLLVRGIIEADDADLGAAPLPSQEG